MQSVDLKKEEFQRYQQASGILDSMVSMLVSLHEMPEKPQDARQFIHDYLTNSGIGEKEALQREIKELKRIIKEKDEQIKDLKEMLEKRV